MKYWFDTEFIEDGKTIELLSIGIVDENGRTYYAELDVDRSQANAFVREHVLPHLIGIRQTADEVKADIRAFVGDDIPEFWGYYSAYDWVALCQLFGTMMDLPRGWPMYCRDLQQVIDENSIADVPVQDEADIHHALSDALWTKRAWEYCFNEVMKWANRNPY